MLVSKKKHLYRRQTLEGRWEEELPMEGDIDGDNDAADNDKANVDVDLGAYFGNVGKDVDMAKNMDIAEDIGNEAISVHLLGVDIEAHQAVLDQLADKDLKIASLKEDIWKLFLETTEKNDIIANQMMELGIHWAHK